MIMKIIYQKREDFKRLQDLEKLNINILKLDQLPLSFRIIFIFLRVDGRMELVVIDVLTYIRIS